MPEAERHACTDPAGMLAPQRDANRWVREPDGRAFPSLPMGPSLRRLFWISPARASSSCSAVANPMGILLSPTQETLCFWSPRTTVRRLAKAAAREIKPGGDEGG
jgi:hypothetical protein